jgi:hypothetical protein
MKKSEITHQGLYNVGFIGNENGPTLFKNSLKTYTSQRANLFVLTSFFGTFPARNVKV